ncbi:MAG: SDR family NAD(P)-dependent oxidoreductase [Arachidicoccus sp.]|nr:SDR family NAD(P)-dependent oxidoreductase [Arachidicoccus sp.]
MKLSNQVAMITGAASGIGKAQALLFSKEGAKIIAADVQSEKLQETIQEIIANGGDAIGITADITDESSVKYLYEKSLEKYGAISILCNTAGIFDNLVLMSQSEYSYFKKIIEVNIEGTYLVTKYVTQNMVANKYGVIVNMASAAGLVGGGGGIAYTMTKHAIIGLTQQLNVEFGHAGIRANAIAPGLIHTPMVEAFMVEGSPIMKTFDEIPAKRSGNVLDIAQTSLFLVSQDASYIYGATIPVDGGLVSTLRL